MIMLIKLRIRLFIQALFISTGMAIYSQSAYAVGINAATMIENLSKTIPNLMQLVTAISYVLGMILIIRSLVMLKEHGEARASHSRSEGGLKGGMIVMAIGTALLYLPSSVQSGLTTFWSNPSPFAYVTEGTNDQWTDLINSVFLIVQLIGTITFIRGLLILSHAGESHSQQGSVGKGLTHIIGGLLCINLYQFLQAVFNTLGLTPI